MASLTLKKLDARMSGYPMFSHVVTTFDQVEFVTVRKWMIETFGHSIELDIWIHDQKSDLSNPKWSWHYPGKLHATQTPNKIYIGDEVTLNWFILKWNPLTKKNS